MFISDVDIKEDAGRNVTVDLPDGRRVTFYYNIKQQNPLILRAVWEAEPGVYDTLTMDADNRLLYDAWNGQILGFFHDYYAYDTPYEESIVPGYVLTTKDGTKYKIKKKVLARDPITDKPTQWGPARLVRVTDTNGNRLLYDDAGIHYGCDQSGANCIEEVLFTRDAAHDNRITAVTDPANNQIVYEYDDAGNLTKVKLQDGSSTRFVYAGDHYLQDIIAPTGVRATRNEYDESGKLIAVIDPDGNRVEFTHKPGTRQEVVKDRLGNITVYEYDDQGQVVSETNALGYRTEIR